MPQLTLDDFAGGTAHLNKAATCTNGRCRFGPSVHLQQSAAESHDSILHGLNRRVGKLFFGVEPFEPTVSSWDGIPIIFGKVHPEPRLFRKDPMAELERVNGAIVGEVSNSRIETAGHHRLMVKKNYTSETAARWYELGLINEELYARSQAAVPIAKRLIKESRLSHSSGFICPDDGDKLTGVVIPDHILDFEETETDQPLDRMSGILNKEGDNVTEHEHLNEGKVMSKKNRDRLKGILDGISTFFNDMLGDPGDLMSAASVPSNPSGYGIAAGKSGGCSLTQADFGDMEFSEIRRRFAFDGGGGTFGVLKLPHHTVTGDVVPACVNAAVAAVEGARTGTPMDLGGKKEAVLSHLRRHQEEIQKAEEKTQMEVIAPQGAPPSSLEGRIEQVRNALSDKVGLKFQDGTRRSIWTIMTLPDKVIWQHPDTSQYFASGYAVAGDDVTFTEPVAVEQAYVVKEAQSVFTNMTAEDIEHISRRNQMDTIEKSAHEAALAEKDAVLAAKDAEIVKLQKERDDLMAAKDLEKKNKEDADWADLKKTIIPPGLVKEPADEDALRKLCKEDPVAFNAKVLSARADPKFKEEGAEHVSGPDAKAREQQEINEILGKSKGRMIPGQLHS